MSSQRDEDSEEGNEEDPEGSDDSNETLCEESEFNDENGHEESGDDEDDNMDEVSEGDGDEHVFRSRRHPRRQAASRISSQQRLDLRIPQSDAAHEDFIYRRSSRSIKDPKARKPELRRSSRRRRPQEYMTMARGNQVILSPAYRLRNRDKHQLPAKSTLGLVSWNSLDVPSEEAKTAREQNRPRRRLEVSDSPSATSSSSASTPVKNRRGTPIEATVVRGDLRFDQIAGVDGFLVQLQEMIVLPLVFPELFSRLGLIPPKGVLFHGPPGTGKTLLARILASASSRMAGRPVAFFHKNGAECLSKWIGEAEQNLVKLFNQAREQAPSIIFFDEIDGMAPDRSGNGRPPDQSHISLVSTLLSLMDGLEDRGAVVVIGATNRLDAVDPALRRPGRFDKEFGFALPDQSARRAILGLSAPLGASIAPWLLDRLARETDGFSGADLKGLCTEAALVALRRSCPTLYQTENVDAGQLQERPDIKSLDLSITEEDFKSAMPARRANTGRESEGIPRPMLRLLESCICQLVRDLERLIWRPMEGSWRAASQLVRLPLATLAFGPDPEGLNSLASLDLLRMKRRFLFTLASRISANGSADVVILDPAALVMGQQQSADAVLMSRFRANQHSGHVLVVQDMDRLFSFVTDDVFALWLQEWSMTETARLLTIEPKSELLSGTVRQRLQVTFSLVGTAERQAFIDYCLGRQDPHDLAAIMGVADSQLPAAEEDSGLTSGHEEEAEDPLSSSKDDNEITPVWLHSFARASSLYHRHIDSQLGW